MIQSRCALPCLALAVVLAACSTELNSIENPTEGGTGSVELLILNSVTGAELHYVNAILTSKSTGKQYGTMSLEKERAQFLQVPSGDYTLTLLYLGYWKLHRELHLVAGETQDLTLKLEPRDPSTYTFLDCGFRK